LSFREVIQKNQVLYPGGRYSV